MDKQLPVFETEKSRFVCEKPVNKRMLICIACGNGSIEYRIELSKTRRQRLGCRAARRGMISCGNRLYLTGQNAVVFGCGTIGIAA